MPTWVADQIPFVQTLLTVEIAVVIQINTKPAFAVGRRWPVELSPNENLPSKPGCADIRAAAHGIVPKAYPDHHSCG